MAIQPINTTNMNNDSEVCGSQGNSYSIPVNPKYSKLLPYIHRKRDATFGVYGLQGHSTPVNPNSLKFSPYTIRREKNDIEDKQLQGKTFSGSKYPINPKFPNIPSYVFRRRNALGNILAPENDNVKPHNSMASYSAPHNPEIKNIPSYVFKRRNAVCEESIKAAIKQLQEKNIVSSD